MKNIVLTGFMGAGKSVVGRRLAKRLAMKVVDTDSLIEKEAGMRISTIFAKYGESYFRELEREVVRRVSNLDNHIVITGGGVVLNPENIESLRKKGIIIHLHATPEALYERVKHKTHRPLLQVEHPMEKIKELLDFRAPFYADNDIEIDTTDLTVDEVVEEIVQKIRSA